MQKIKISTAQFENKSGDGIATAGIVPEKLTQAGGYRYIQARRPELYRDVVGNHNQSVQKVAWLNA